MCIKELRKALPGALPGWPVPARMSVYDLAGRWALVTGGARGLGAGMAEALTPAGAAVVIGDIREDLGEETADTLRRSGATAGFVPLDVTDDASWEQAIPVVIGELGGLDIVVNNAGVEISGLIADLDLADLRRMLDVNVVGTALGIKHAFRAMRPGARCGSGATRGWPTSRCWVASSTAR
jgi:3alpha(or 20beta)-hydroxysteroid dehydrogenase